MLSAELLLAAELSSFSYLRTDKEYRESCAALFGYASTAYVPISESTRVWIHDRVCYVVFRGTFDIVDCEYDCEVLFVRVAGAVHVHSGFYEKYRADADIMKAFFASNDDRIDRFVFAGHSLGGAVAQIAAAFLRSKPKKEPLRCYTFGSPRVGDRAWRGSPPSAGTSTRPATTCA